MKPKGEITPLSKKDQLLVTHEQKIAVLAARQQKLAQELAEATDELNGEKQFDATVKKAAKKLKLDAGELDSAFNGSKGELVKKFNRRNCLTSDIKTGYTLTSVFCAFTGLLGYAGVANDRFALLFAAMTGAVAGACSYILYKEKKEIQAIDQSIRGKVSEQKRLSFTPSPPKP